jgi:uncharacterized protein (DUF58 family)
MTTEGRHRPGEPRGFLGRLGRSLVSVLWPTQRLLWTREGVIYVVIWIVLLLLGLQQQINLILLVAGLAAGPVVASFVVSAAILRKLQISRRVPPYAFSGDPLHLDYTLENARRWTAALALFIEDDVVPVDRTVSGSGGLTPRVFYPRVPGGERARVRWQGISPKRGAYKFRTLELITRSPFGLLERRVTVTDPDELIVYPMVGQLTRRWHLMQRQATETRRGQRHDRSSQQQEYHGLRDYRPGDSPRWIHWRTSARLGQPMVKEFEQQNEQDLAVLLDPWLPRTKVTPEQRDALEQSVQFAATLCLETCRHQGRRLLMGWTGPTPGIRQGPASVKLLHELLEQLAKLRSSSEVSLSALFDVLPPATLREAIIIIVSTRPINLTEEAERSARLSGSSSRGLLGRVVLLDASKGDLLDLIQYGEATTSTLLTRRDTSSLSTERSIAPSISREAVAPRNVGSGNSASSDGQPRPSLFNRNGQEERG